MPRKYVRKTARVEIDENRVKAAMKAVLTKLSQYKAAQDYGVKRQTIQSRIKTLLKKKTLEEVLRGFEDSGNESDDNFSYSSKYSSQQIFTSAQEANLVAYIKRCADLNYGLTYETIRHLAYDYAKALPDCKLPTNWDSNKIAGRDWLLGFMHRHKNEISLRKPENTSLARSMAFNKPTVDNFFSKYKSVLEKYKFGPHQIWNLDETGLTTVMEPPKVVATKGKKQVANVSSQERGESITVVGIINAAGGTVPPVFLYPRLRNPEEYLEDDYPAGSLALGNKTGYMTAEIFPQVIEHFAVHVKCSKENKNLLIMDNHESHISVKAIEMCREKGIVLFTVPPHTTNKLQPLDVGINAPFKKYMAIAQHDWLLSNPGKVITIRHLARLAKISYEKAFTIKNITSSFQATGLWPVNRLVFSDNDFAPAEVLDKPLLVNDLIETSSAEITTNSKSSLLIPIEPKKMPELEKTPPMPSTSQMTLLSEIRPFPKADFKENKAKKSRKGKSAVYTDTPEYEERKSLEQIHQKRKMSVTKREKTVKRNLSKIYKNRKNSTSSESSVDVFINDSSDENQFMEEMMFLNNEDNVTVGSFVLVEFVVTHNSQKSEVYYAGEILSADEEGYEVKFMRRKSRSHHFIFPDIDISTVEKKDIVAILPYCTKQGTTRTSRVYIFNVNFSSFNVR